MSSSNRGYVMAVFSRRVRGCALPVDLLRVHLRALNSAGMARRLRAAFAGYLVSDAEAGSLFSNRRAVHQMRRVGVMGTGYPFASEFGGDLDAPEWILAGSVVESFGEPFPTGVRRGEL